MAKLLNVSFPLKFCQHVHTFHKEIHTPESVDMDQ